MELCSIGGNSARYPVEMPCECGKPKPGTDIFIAGGYTLRVVTVNGSST